MTKTKFNNESYAARVGRVTGYLMGKHIQNPDVAMKAMDLLAKGEINKFLSTVPEAVRVKVQNLVAPNGIPFALDAHELAEMTAKAKEGFNKAVSAKAKTAPAPKPNAAPPRSKQKTSLTIG